jgi:hypothetical protein
MRIRTDNQLKNDEKLRTKFLRLKAFEDAKIAIQVYEESLLEKMIVDNQLFLEKEQIYSEKEIKKIDIESIPLPPLKLGRVRSRKIFYPYDLIVDNDNKIIDIIHK